MTKNKLLLIDPPFQIFNGSYRFYFPGGLASIAANSIKAGYDVSILDLEHQSNLHSFNFVENTNSFKDILKGIENNTIWDNYKDFLEKFQPDAVGISVFTPKMKSALKVAEITKEFNKNLPIIVGGNHVNTRPQDLLKNKTIDYAIRGEGEFTFIELLDNIFSGENNLDNIRGLSHKKDGIIINNKTQNPIADLDSLEIPSRESLLNIETYRPIDLGMILTSRGCQYRCTFCEVPIHWPGKVRFRSLDNVMDEIVSVKEKYGTEYFSFRDSTFTFDKNRTLELCDKIHKEIPDMKWECLTKPNHLDKELLDVMKNAGCVKIRVGVESGSPEIIEYMRKNVSIEQVKETAKLLHNSEIDWSAYFMLGVPRETEKTMDETLKLMKEIDPPFISLTRYTPMPGSQMYDEVVDAKLLNPDDTDWTWSANQSLDSVFVKYMSPEKFKTKMELVGQYVKHHNIEKGNMDQRLK